LTRHLAWVENKNMMDLHGTTPGFHLRPATAADDRAIHQIIAQVQINPMGLDWRHFILAVDTNDKLIGCGQLKPHRDGSVELASIAVVPGWRGRGVARRVIEYLIEQHPGRLYLTCRSELGPLYRKFGFEVVAYSEMPPYFKRVSRLVTMINKLSHRPVVLLVMRKE
jgi:N-acetylglutamate synthase-like GNAT family acetyltransferase